MGRKLLYSLFFSIALYFIAAYFAKQLPDPSEINRELLRMPKQSDEPSQDPFQFKYEGESYLVYPQADYELKGLVVSHNNIGSISDSYHDSKSVDLKDLCVLYASNVIDDVYQKVKFSSGSWTCYASWGAGVDFNMDHLSNNHLLSNDPAIREKIRNVNIGDQVHLKGYLVNYANKKHPEWLRKSSMTRTDHGNTACEVFYVTSLKVLKRGNAFWYGLQAFAFYLSFLVFFSYLYYLVVHSNLSFRKNKVEDKVKFSKY